MTDKSLSERLAELQPVRDEIAGFVNLLVPAFIGKGRELPEIPVEGKSLRRWLTALDALTPLVTAAREVEQAEDMAILNTLDAILLHQADPSEFMASFPAVRELLDLKSTVAEQQREIERLKAALSGHAIQCPQCQSAAITAGRTEQEPR